jgi:hypothetical protein
MRGSELSGHTLIDCVADDAVGDQILDGAAVDLALGGGGSVMSVTHT